MTSLRPPSLDDFLDGWHDRLVELRRDLHAHPELGRHETRTTQRVADILADAGLSPLPLPGGSGLVCDIGPGAPVVGLRADLDALPLPDAKTVPYRSTYDGVCHACGHDVHTTVVAGAGVYLARAAESGALPHGVRLLFQPAEEVMPGGALDLIDAGALDGLARVYALHCDPSIDAGQVGLRTGAITSASDLVTIALRGPGGHTARPQLTADLVTALGAVATQVPAALARRLDPRAGVNLVWGRISAGTAANVIPSAGTVVGTLRMLDRDVWERVPPLLAEVARAVAAPYGVEVDVSHLRGVPPVVNDGVAVAELAAAARVAVGPDSVCGTEQSLGGEDFGWMLEKVPGALARLGVRAPGGPVHDLHQADFDIDERAIDVGVRLLATVAAAARPAA